jgi:DNA polymerase III delta prime subunit
MKNVNITWIDKYKPLKINEITTNINAVKSIYNWLISFDKIKKTILNNQKKKKSDDKKEANRKNKKSEFKSCLLITGSHGVGKTMTIEVILKELNYNVQHIDISIIKNNKNIKDIINKIMISSNILNIIGGKEHKKMAIMIDEIESITASAEKNCILSLQKLNDVHWYCPIIFISNNQHNKLLSEIKKTSHEIRLWPPFPSEMKKILMKITMNEQINIKNEKIIDKVLIHSQNDIRRLIFTLQELKYAYGTKYITLDMINEFCEMSKMKDIDIDLYKATEGLLYEYKSINDCLRYFETEKVLLPLMVHQNYIKSVIANYEDNNKRHKTIKKITESLSTGDVVENYIYGDQNWDMQEIHGFYTCVLTSFNLNHGLEHDLERVNLAFATDLNKTSIKKINKKNINNTDRCFKNMNIFDYIYINKIIRKLISEGKIKDCFELLKNYKIKLEHIESLLKIDKIKDTKTSLTSKQKNEFLNFIQE